MTSFQVTRKKTPFQKHKEEEEAKKRQADEEAARVYEEFVESFASDERAPKTFIRGGVIDPSKRVSHQPEGPGSKASESASKKPGSRYVPSFLPPSMAAALGKPKEPEPPPEETPEPKRDKDKPRVRQIDNFMEELRKEQERREERQRTRRDGKVSLFDVLPEDTGDKEPGSFDDGDPLTTNLYVGNLAPQVDENFLMRTFGRFGPIASVKIMWPRTDDERRRQRNCGFVAFMKRKDAEAAQQEMQAVVVHDYELRIGWGKAVPLPAQALPAPPPGQSAFSLATVTGVAAVPLGLKGVIPPRPEIVPLYPDVKVEPPEDEFQRKVIDTVALFVLDDGCAFEQAIMERERDNPLYRFLFDLISPDHTYYRWRVHSFAQGDTLERWRTEPFIMVLGGPRWLPPPAPERRSPARGGEPQTAAAQTGRGLKPGERALTDPQRDEFEDMLRALTLERAQIRDAMGFALDNAEAANEVVDVLIESLTLFETPIPTKVARLMLVSDILHNSSAPVKNASAYRTLFEARLPDVLESFNELYRNITGRITAEALKERVIKVLYVWADWFLFSESFIFGLRATFLRPSHTNVPAFHSIPLAAPPDDPAPTLASPEDNPSGEGKEPPEEVGEQGEGQDGPDGAKAGPLAPLAEQFLQTPLVELEKRCRHAGLSTRGGRRVMADRLLYLEEEVKRERGEDPVLGSKAGTAEKAQGGFARARQTTGLWTEVGVRGEEGEGEQIGLVAEHYGPAVATNEEQYGPAVVTNEEQYGSVVVTNGGGDQGWVLPGNYDDDDDGNAGSPRQGVAFASGTLAIPEPSLPIGQRSAAAVPLVEARVEEPPTALAQSRWNMMDPEGEEEKQEDLEGEAGRAAKKAKFPSSSLPPSKWVEDEPEEGEEANEERSEGGSGGRDHSRSPGEITPVMEDERAGGQASGEGSDDIFEGAGKLKAGDVEVTAASGDASRTPMDEEQRHRLRKLELACMEYREGLEERGIKDKEEVDKRVAVHRRKLEAEYERKSQEKDRGREKSRDREREKEKERERERSSRGEGGEMTAGKAFQKAISEVKATSGSKSRDPDRTSSRGGRGSSSSKKRARSHSRSRSPHRGSKERGGSHGHKDRDRDRERDRDRDRDRDREKEREKDKKERERSRERRDRDRRGGR